MGQDMFTQSGKLLTPADMVAIEQRHEGKARLLAEMRADREAQYGHKHAHVGTEMARDLADYALIANTYHNFAAMANYCALAGKDGAGRTLQALANGLMRGAVEMFGKDIEQRIYDYQSITLAGVVSQRLDGSNVAGLELSRTDQLEPLGFVDDRTPEQREADGDADLAAAIRGELPPVPDISLEDAEANLINRGGSLYSATEPVVSESWSDTSDDEREPGDALREAVSPEPEDTPQRRAARLRREAKRLQRLGQGATE